MGASAYVNKIIVLHDQLSKCLTTYKTRQNGIVVCKLRCRGKVYTEASMVYPKWKGNNIHMLHYNIVETHILLLPLYQYNYSTILQTWLNKSLSLFQYKWES